MLPREEDFLKKFHESIPDCADSERDIFAKLAPMALTIYRIGFMEGQLTTLQAVIEGGRNGSRLN